jgi:hypothetical protein
MRLATQHDVETILTVLRKVWAKSPAPQMKFVDPVSAECGIRDAVHNNRAVIDGDFFVMFDVGKVWYSNETFLIEELVLRISHDDLTGPSTAVKTLDALKERFKCAAIFAGDTQVQAMTNHYIRGGYVLLGNQLMKG